jgi:transposase
MRILYRRCAGLDVHKASVVACVLAVKETNRVEEQVQRFGTMTEELKELAAWLKSQAVERVAMESTGVYWKPVWNILEAAELDLLLANAQQVKALPGRKTDQKDSQWLADLLMHGLLKNSFVPSRVIRDLRDLTRSRARLAQWHGTIANRIQKVLEDANIKLSSVASDVLGASGRLMLQAIMQGKTDTSELAELSKGRLREKIPQLRKALEGHVTGHHRLLLRRHWEQFQFLKRQLVKTDAEIARRMKYTPEELAQVKAALPPGTPLPPCPRQAALEYWVELPGISLVSGSSIVAEIGADMTQYPSAAHLASWATLCPGHDESAGKRRSGRTRKGNKWLRRTMSEAAWAASHAKDTYFAAQFRRIAARRGKKRANIAVAHSLLVTGYTMLTKGCHYKEVGASFYDTLYRDKVKKSALKKLEALGYEVTLKTKAEQSGN